MPWRTSRSSSAVTSKTSLQVIFAKQTSTMETPSVLELWFIHLQLINTSSSFDVQNLCQFLIFVKPARPLHPKNFNLVDLCPDHRGRLDAANLDNNLNPAAPRCWVRVCWLACVSSLMLLVLSSLKLDYPMVQLLHVVGRVFNVERKVC